MRGSLRPEGRSCHWQAGRFAPFKKADWRRAGGKESAGFSADNKNMRGSRSLAAKECPPAPTQESRLDMSRRQETGRLLR